MEAYETFCKILEDMRGIFDYEPPYDAISRTGIVMSFRLCFEQSWKMMKEILSDQGYAEAVTGSPKQILKLAYSCGMITDEKQWLAALAARNNVAHSYNERIALSIVDGAKTQYYAMFCRLKDEVEKNCLE